MNSGCKTSSKRVQKHRLLKNQLTLLNKRLKLSTDSLSESDSENFKNQHFKNINCNPDDINDNQILNANFDYEYSLNSNIGTNQNSDSNSNKR